MACWAKTRDVVAPCKYTREEKEPVKLKDNAGPKAKGNKLTRDQLRLEIGSLFPPPVEGEGSGKPQTSSKLEQFSKGILCHNLPHKREPGLEPALKYTSWPCFTH